MIISSVCVCSKSIVFTGDFIQSTPEGIHLNINAAQTVYNFKFKQILLKLSTNLPFKRKQDGLFSQIHCNCSNLVSLAFEAGFAILIFLQNERKC